MQPRSGEELIELEARQEPRLVKALEMVARRHWLADAIAQSQALSPSIRKKNVRKMASVGMGGRPRA